MHPATKNWLEFLFAVFAALLFAYFAYDSLMEEEWFWAFFELVFTGYWANRATKVWARL